MQLTLAEVVKEEELITGLEIVDFTRNPTTSRDANPSKSLLIIINGSNRVALIDSDDKGVPSQLTLENVLSRKIGENNYADLARLFSYHQDSNHGLEFKFKLDDDDKEGKYSGLKEVPKKDRKKLRAGLRAIFNYYNARQYVKDKTEAAGLVYGTIETIWDKRAGVAKEETRADLKPVFFEKGKSKRQAGPTAAYLDGNVLYVTNRKYLALFREIAKTLEKDYNIVQFRVASPKERAA